jgi:KAP family P-loop domain/NB-ARC domain
MTQAQGSDAWIAYHRADADWVEALARRLGDEGLTVFYDEFGRSPGEMPGSARVNILVVSDASLSRGWLSMSRAALLRLESSGGRLLWLQIGLRPPSSPPTETIPSIRFPGGGVADERAFQLLLAFIRLPSPVSNVPAQPSGVSIRTRELEELLAFFEANKDGRPMAAIVGRAGLGKTSLARYLANGLLRFSFTDGQLFCGVARRSTLAQALRLLLDELGLPRSELFQSLSDQINAYRVLTRGRRILLVLDAVSDMDQVADLLPTTRGSGVVLTARSVPAGFGTDADVQSMVVDLEPLSKRQAFTLLESEAGTERVQGDLDAVEAALDQLAGAPILISLLGRQLREHPDLPVHTVVRDFVLAEREPEGRRLSTGLLRAYQAMPEGDRTLFRRLEVLLDPEVEVGLGAALVDSPVDEVGASLERLVEAQLVEPSGAGRYRVRELARDLARERLGDEETEEARQAALRRALRWLAVRNRYQPDARIARDFWTADDTLGYEQYADAIAAFIRHQETRPPLTIGVKAPWGAGKTSLMRMVQERLDPPGDRRTWRPTRLRLSPRSRASLGGDEGPLTVVSPQRRRPRQAAMPEPDGKAARNPVTILELLRRATGGPRAADADLEALDVDPPTAERRTWRPTVWFNPWMYQSGEQVWAGLAHEIITQISGRMEPGDRERFWLELNLRRIDLQAVRRRIYRLLAERFLPLAAAFGVAILLVAALGVTGWLLPATRAALRWPSVGVLSLGTLGVLLDGVRRIVRFFREDAAGQFRPLVGEPDLAAGSKRLLEEQAKGSLDELLRDPGYQGRLGFLYLVQTDMRRVLDLVATDRRPLVVFVDDLDRCSPSTVAQVIEAINLFLAGEFPNCIFVLAVEPAVVAAHVELAYKDLAHSFGTQGRAGRSSTLGWRFLEKIVQLPLSLPLPAGAGHVDRYVDSLLGTAPAVAADLAGPLEDGGSRLATDGTARDTTTGESAGAETARQGIGAPALSREPSLRMDLVRRIEDAIRRDSPTVETLPEAARRAQDAVLGGQAAEALLPESLEAANRVFVEFYSDADSRDAIVAALPALDSANPREIKRFINLFRFYTFIAQQDRLRNVPAPDGREIAKLAVLAIRWPHLLNALGARLATEDAPTALALLERQARAESGGWEQALTAVGLDGGGDLDHTWSGDLRDFLAADPPIATASARLL